VVTVIWHKAASLPYMDGSIVFTRLCHCAPVSLIHGSLEPLRLSITNCASWSVQPFLFSSQHRIPYKGPPLHSKLSICVGNLEPNLINGSLGPPESTPKQHLDRFSHFYRAHDHERKTDWQTDHTTVCKNRLHLCSTAMWPNKNWACVRTKVISKHTWSNSLSIFPP